MKQIQVKFAVLILSTFLARMHKEPVPNAFEAHDIGSDGAYSFTHHDQALNSEIVFLLPVQSEYLLAIVYILPLLLHLDFFEPFDLFLLFLEPPNLL